MSLPLILSMGDPAGIGPEITVKAWQSLRARPNQAFAVVAPPDIFNTFLGSQDIQIIGASELSSENFADIFANALPVIPIHCPHVNLGTPNPRLAPAITGSIERAVKLCLDGYAAGIVTNPIAKEVLYKAGFSHPGHTEYLGVLTQDHPAPYARGPVMMLTAQNLRAGLVTIHEPLAAVAPMLSTDLILEKARIMLGALQTDYGIKHPRLALCGLNPHAGEGGMIGAEEINIINPAAVALRAQGFDVTDAQPADTLFHAEARLGYDAVLAMYHDQGLIPVKTLDFHGGVNVTLGLPIVRTSPDHGTAFDIAGQNKARPDSLIAAIAQARIIADNRGQSAV